MVRLLCPLSSCYRLMLCFMHVVTILLSDYAFSYALLYLLLLGELTAFAYK